MRLILALVLLCVSHGLAAAAPKSCQTSIAGETAQLRYDTDDDAVAENRSYRERLFGKFGQISCPGYVTLRSLTPDLTDAERAPFCLQYDKARKTYTGIVIGDRDGFVGCKAPSKSFCEHVNATRDTALGIAALGADIVVGRGASATGVSAVEHSSGALILSGAGPYIADALGSLGGSALAAVSAPGTLTAAAVSVVAVGGAVYVCSE